MFYEIPTMKFRDWIRASYWMTSKLLSKQHLRRLSWDLLLQYFQPSPPRHQLLLPISQVHRGKIHLQLTLISHPRLVSVMRDPWVYSTKLSLILSRPSCEILTMKFLVAVFWTLSLLLIKASFQTSRVDSARAQPQRRQEPLRNRFRLLTIVPYLGNVVHARVDRSCLMMRSEECRWMLALLTIPQSKNVNSRPWH
jgi:hypothetical protein